MSGRLVWLILFLLKPGPLAAEVGLHPVASGLEYPVYATHSGDGSGRLFILEQQGRIVLLEAGTLSPFLDIRQRVAFGGEMGLLGLAFHPLYSSNGRFFLNYTRQTGGLRETVVSEYRVDPNDPRAALAGEKVLLTFEQPYTNHNGGHLAFGPDGFLYISTGDGGDGGDPHGHGQNLNTLLGKILRIDVNSGDPYGIPPDNPFVGQPGAREEIWAYGLRNPWRFSFDWVTGRLFAGDVGQNAWEEIDLIQKGGNYGWNRMEGPACFAVPAPCSEGTELPIAAYGRTEGTSVIGGYVYRGPGETGHLGAYLFGDYGSGRIWSLRESGGDWQRQELLGSGRRISSFGEDEAGRIYLVDHGTSASTGEVLQLIFPSRLIFAHRADGPSADGRFRSRLMLSNAQDSEVVVTLRFFSFDGTPQELSLAGRIADEHEFTLPADSSAPFSIDSPGGELVTGWTEVQSTGPVAGSILYSLLDDAGTPQAEAGIASSAAGTLHLAHVEHRGTVSTGVAVVNLSPSSPATVTFTVTEPNGNQLDSRALVVGPRGQLARFIWELVELPGDFEGTLRIDSTEQTAATLIRTRDGIQSASLPLATR